MQANFQHCRGTCQRCQKLANSPGVSVTTQKINTLLYSATCGVKLCSLSHIFISTDVGGSWELRTLPMLAVRASSLSRDPIAVSDSYFIKYSLKKTSGYCSQDPPSTFFDVLVTQGICSVLGINPTGIKTWDFEFVSRIVRPFLDGYTIDDLCTNSDMRSNLLAPKQRWLRMCHGGCISITTFFYQEVTLWVSSVFGCQWRHR